MYTNLHRLMIDETHIQWHLFSVFSKLIYHKIILVKKVTNIFTMSKLYPSNNCAENLWKFPGIFPGNPRKFPEIFHRKIQWKCQQLYPGISRNPFRGTRSEEFLVTHSEEILVTLSKEFLVTNSREFLVANSSEKPEKICSKKVFRTNSWEFPWNYSQDFLKKFLRNFLIYSLTKVVNNLTTILPLQLFRSITIFLSQNIIVVFDLTEVVM